MGEQRLRKMGFATYPALTKNRSETKPSITCMLSLTPTDCVGVLVADGILVGA